MTSAPTSNAVKVFQRIFFGSLALAILGLVFWLDARIAAHFLEESGWLALRLSRGSMLPLFIAVVAIFGTLEMIHFFRAKGAQLPAVLTCSLIVFMILSPWLWVPASDPHEFPARTGLPLLVPPLLSIIVASAFIVLRGRPADTLRDLSATMTTVFYMGFLLSFPVDMRCNLSTPGPSGAWLLLTVVLIIKASDIGAYFTGTFFGRHKLIPAVSPAKSVEGMFGGLIFSGLVAVLFIHWTAIGELQPFARWGASANHTLSDYMGDDTFRLIAAFAFGITLSIVGQLGDLIESCFKRDAGTKDSGYVMPRLGGILDLIDSPLPAIPMGWLILTLA